MATPNGGLESDCIIRHARSFWIITATFVVVGIGLVSGSVLAGLGPIAMVCGVLLLWSGVVKAIVLRIWRTTLNSASAPDHTRRDSDSETVIGQRT
jgi:hypothetical protein